MIEKVACDLRALSHRLSNSISVARGEAHAAFDPLWKSKCMSRTAAYKWLAEQMKMPVEKCHIKKFDVEQCRFVVALCNKQKT